MGVFALPYMFTNYEDCYKLIDQNWDEINKRMIAESGNMAVGWLVQGFRVLSNSKRPINTIEDLKGLKIRVPNNPIMIGVYRAWGTDPVPMAMDETFNALQQKVVYGQENPYPVFASNKFEEVQKYITDIHYMLWVAPILVSERWFAKLDPDTRELFVRAAREAAEYEWKWSEEEDAKALQQCIDGGMVIGTVSDEDKWAEKARSVWPKFYDTVGGKQFVDQALEAMK